MRFTGSWSRWFVVVGVTAGAALGLGVAAPAYAFDPGGLAPEPLMTSSELAAAGTGAAEGAELAGSAGVAAFAPVAPLAVAGIGFRIGFSAVGMVLAPFGISPGEDLCQITGGGNVPLNTVTNVLTGADCSRQMTANTLTPAQQNLDQAATTVPGGVGTVSCTPSMPGFAAYCVTIYALIGTGTAQQYCLGADGTAPVGRRSPIAHYRGGASFGGSVYSTTPASSCKANGSAAYAVLSVWTAGGSPVVYTSIDTWKSSQDVATSTSVSDSVTRPNPSRHYDCKITGNDGNTYTASSDSFTQADASTAPLRCPTLPGGVLPTNAEVTLVTPGEADQVVVPEVGTTPAYQASAAAYPDCAASSCHLQVWTVAGQNCANVGTCADWFADPQKTADYQCHYGTHVVDLSECNVMSQFYDPQKQAAGQAYSDPSTGAPVTKPDPTTGVQTPVQTSPRQSAAISTEGAQDPTARGDCFPTGWGIFNPVEWVQKPAQCAMEWAFAPRESVLQDDFTATQTAWKATMPGQIIAAVSGWNLQPVMTGCAGYDFPNVLFSGVDWKIGDACPGTPLAPVAAWSFVISDILAIAGGAFAIVRIASRVFNYEGPVQ